MKKRVHKILAFLICTVILASSFVVFAAAARVDTGYFEYASLSYSVSLFTYEDNAFDDDLIGNSYVEATDLLFSDNVTLVSYCKVGFTRLAQVLYQYELDGYYAPCVNISFTFPKGRFLLDDFTLYSTSSTAFYVGESPYESSYGGNPSFVDDFEIIVRSDVGLETSLPAAWLDGRWVPDFSGTSISYGAEYTVSGFSFAIYPNYTFDRSGWLSDLAARLGFSSDGQQIDSANALKFWGYPGLYFDASDVDAARQDGYDRGYETGSQDAYFRGFEEGEHQGYFDGNEDGYLNGLSNGFDSGYREGFYDGELSGIEQGKDIGYSLGYDSGFAKGFTEGGSTDLDLNLGELFFSVIDAPVRVIVNMFDFNFLGFNLASLFKALFTLVICLGLFLVLMKVIV